MKETGIIMSGNHPKLILDGTKTMTRRTAGLNEINKEPNKWEYMRTLNDGEVLFWVIADDPEPDIEKRVKLVKCPYGQVGDRLWVRETMIIDGYLDMYYVADNAVVDPEDENVIADWQYGTKPPEWKGVIPSIHMPRWASRITREITEVRVERVQEITEEDAEAEGTSLFIPNNPYKEYHNFRTAFMYLWDSLNAKRGYGWEVDPFCWVISFKVRND